MSVKDYWDERFTAGLDHHLQQNYQITRDFMNAVAARSHDGHVLMNAALSARRVVEIGCGTGNLTAMIRSFYGTPDVLGTDFSPRAVAEASVRFPGCRFKVFDVLHDSPARVGRHDLAVASNVLEHFKDPYAPLEKMLDLADKVLVLVPFDQPCTDGYEGEGGAGHVFQFKADAFAAYQVDDETTFRTEGWQHSAKGETPTQWAVLLRRKVSPAAASTASQRSR